MVLVPGILLCGEAKPSRPIIQDMPGCAYITFICNESALKFSVCFETDGGMVTNKNRKGNDHHGKC